MNNFLLTYDAPNPHAMGTIKTYEWFETEEELRDFVAEKKRLYPHGFKVNESMKIIDDAQIDVYL